MLSSSTSTLLSRERPNRWLAFTSPLTPARFLKRPCLLPRRSSRSRPTTYTRKTLASTTTTSCFQSSSTIFLQPKSSTPSFSAADKPPIEFLIRPMALTAATNNVIATILNLRVRRRCMTSKTLTLLPWTSERLDRLIERENS